MINKGQAIHSLNSEAEYKIKSDGSVIFLNGTPSISDSVIETELERLQAEYDSKQYARDRAEAYPSLTDQADMLWHSIDEGVFGVAAKESPFYLANKKVKDDNPKNL